MTELVALAQRLIAYDTSDPESISEAAGFGLGGRPSREPRPLRMRRLRSRVCHGQTSASLMRVMADSGP